MLKLVLGRFKPTYLFQLLHSAVYCLKKAYLFLKEYRLQVRTATENDLESILALAAAKRDEYAAYSPLFWRPAAGANEKQALFFLNQRLGNAAAITLVAESNGSISGFIMALVQAAPPVYDPGGPVCSIDDFTVATPDLWSSVGTALLNAATAQAQAAGAVLVIVVCGQLDTPKRIMLESCGASVASEWFVKPL